MAGKLRVVGAFTLPLGELSGVCVRSLGDEAELLAIGDSSPALVRGPLGAAGPAGDFSTIDLTTRAASSAPQWEAIVADGAGQLYLLEESPGGVIVLSPDLCQRVARIELSVDADGARHARGWADDDNSRGEGLALLTNGHLLVVKEKRPALLVEFGPRGAIPGGVSPDLLRLRSGFPLAAEALDFVPLAAWTVEDVDVEDVSDLAVADDRLFLLSDQSRCIVEVDPRLAPGGASVAALSRWSLPRRVKKPEGLAFIHDLTPLVVTDDEQGEENLFVLEPLQT